ncbi:hypothetical protein SCLCIDRAFT_124876 [Scleroderma citrinum Foug A]|uniref:DDE-1 domain-containing protein n=1 Tax=Scleroderma citrinum Foug A TaxID=1036808 RepID=A0A0C3DVF3_9AGAM|nr:hypothetical protein SCLCIDRAFT_124876 [Scleroderma citrinum Foug A]
MLQEKRARFEDEFDVPEKERLTGEGWLHLFCKTYKIQEHQWHGEAGSVDLAAVGVEQQRCQKIMVGFAPQDHFNFDETALFPYAPPDRGLATRQLSGKKKEKIHITIGLACNADGTEKLEPIFIGKSSKPRCFKKYTPEQCGFYYRNNKKAWMTSSIFEEYVFVFPSMQMEIN